jgi:hypothetical protein
VRGLNVFVNIGAKLMPSLNASAGAVERRFGLMGKRIRRSAAETRLAMREMNAAASPLLGLAAAGGLMFSAKKAIGDSAALAHELQMLRNAGRTSREVAQAMAAANKTITALPTSSLLDNLKVLNETTGAFGSFQHAVDNLTFNQKVGGMLQNMLGDKAGDEGAMFNNLVRGMEMRGSAQNSGRYQREVGELYRAMVFTRGRVNPEEFLTYSQTANPYTKGLTERYLTKIAPSLIQEFGGDRAGTMQNTFIGTLLGKAKNKISTEAWMKLGLLDPKGIVSNKVGPVGFMPGAMKGTDLALQDPLKWAETILIPALRKSGVDTNNQVSLQKALMPLFRDRNANRLANSLVYDQDRKRLHKDEGLINKVPTLDAAYNQSLRNDPTMGLHAVSSSLSNLSSVLFGTGKGESPVAIALVHVANGINMVAQFLEAHPTLAKGLGALLLGSAGLAGLRVIGVGLGWIFSPLKGIFRLLFSAVGGAGPKIPLIRRILGWLRPLGGLLLRGLVALGPILLRGLAMAFGLLSNPVGWAIIAATVAILIWKYRHEIASAWNNIVVPWFGRAWQAIKNYALSINWRGIGMAIADALTFGLASKFAAGLAKLKPSAQALAGNVGMNSTRGGLAGARAAGGPVRRGGLYLVGEHGPELFRAGAGGNIFNHKRTAAMIAGAAGMAMSPAHAGTGAGLPRQPIEIHIHGAHDPDAVATAVRRELEKLARQQGAYLSD